MYSPAFYNNNDNIYSQHSNTHNVICLFNNAIIVSFFYKKAVYILVFVEEKV